VTWPNAQNQPFPSGLGHSLTLPPCASEARICLTFPPSRAMIRLQSHPVKTAGHGKQKNGKKLDSADRSWTILLRSAVPASEYQPMHNLALNAATEFVAQLLVVACHLNAFELNLS
jgi:hypothetical protein